MSKLCTFAAVLLWTSTSFAQEPPAPKPAEELQQLKDMVGVWKCEGKTTVGGKEMKDTTKASFSWDLDKFFLAGRIDSPKSPGNPNGFKGRVMYGYDAGTKQFIAMGVDNMGGMSTLTSKGWNGDKLEWAGKSKMMGMEMDTKETITRKGPREVTLSGSTGSGPQGVTWESTCKK